jgi:hypothetical protein
VLYHIVRWPHEGFIWINRKHGWTVIYAANDPVRAGRVADTSSGVERWRWNDFSRSRSIRGRHIIL